MAYQYEQLALDDALTAREIGISRADDHALPQWRTAAALAVRWCASNLADFTADEVLARLAAVRAPKTHEPSALGPVFLAAARAGIIVKTGELRPTRLARRHRELTVWTSAVPRGGPATVPAAPTPTPGDQLRR